MPAGVVTTGQRDNIMAGMRAHWGHGRRRGRLKGLEGATSYRLRQHVLRCSSFWLQCPTGLSWGSRCHYSSLMRPHTCAVYAAVRMHTRSSNEDPLGIAAE